MLPYASFQVNGTHIGNHKRIVACYCNLNESSPLQGKTFREADRYNNCQVNVVSYKLPAGERHSTPKPSEVMQKDGTRIAIGHLPPIPTFQSKKLIATCFVLCSR
uniref:Uncharacterized protein n=1 Tax=Chlorobium phaeobacteroides (strain BS1) TaxID=331678 RepID=B3EK08_CHLPB